MSAIEDQKKKAALAAIEFVEDGMMVGVGTGSTVAYFIEALAPIKHIIEGTVASSSDTEEKLKSHKIPVFDLNTVNQVHLYVDGADQANPALQLIKGGGGALTREKILAAASGRFVCIIDERKYVDVFSDIPLPVEVIPMARSYVGRQLVALGGHPEYRQGFTTDNGNVILDVYNFEMLKLLELSMQINQIPGVVGHGLFASERANVLLIGQEKSVKRINAQMASF